LRGAVQVRERKSSPKSQRRRSWSMCVEKSRDGRFSGAQIGSPPRGVIAAKTAHFAGVSCVG